MSEGWYIKSYLEMRIVKFSSLSSIVRRDSVIDHQNFHMMHNINKNKRISHTCKFISKYQFMKIKK